jgi:hypothetical protein
MPLIALYRILSQSNSSTRPRREQHPHQPPYPSCATPQQMQYPSALYFFFGPSIGSPILLPVKRTFAAFCSFRIASIGG